VNKHHKTLINSLISLSTDEKRGYFALDSNVVRETMLNPMFVLLQENAVHFTVFAEDFGWKEDEFTLLQANKSLLSEKYVNQNASGGSFFTFIKAEMSATNLPFLTIFFDLKEELAKDKEFLANLAISLPYLIKAILEDCRARKILGISINLEEIVFHSLDNKPYRYYDCMMRLLEKFHHSLILPT
jgi:hypothetical protein